MVTGPNMTSILPWEDRATAPPTGKCFTISKASTPVSVDGPLLKVIASFACCGTSIAEMRISSLGTRQTKFLTWNHKHVFRQTSYLARMSMDESDGCHKANSSLHAIPKVSRILNVSVMVVMGVDEGVNDTHYHEPILKASWKTWEIKSWKRWPLRGSAVACPQIEVNTL